MSNLSGPLNEMLAEEIPRVAAKAHRAYKLIPQEDLAQSLWLHALSNAERFEGYYREDSEAAIWTALSRAARRLVREDERYRRAAKAAAAGYAPDDECFYSVGVLRIALPIYLETGMDTPPQSGLNLSGRGGNGTAEDYYAVMVDIGRGLEKLSAYQRNLIIRWFSLPQGDDDEGRWIREAEASTMGITLNAFRQRVDRALASLQYKLGGANPWQGEKRAARRPEGYPLVVPAEQNRGGSYFEPDPRGESSRAEEARAKWKGSWPSTPVNVGVWDK